MPASPDLRQQEIFERLTRQLTPTHLHLEDESAAHAGHAGAAGGAGHYRLVIVSAAFIGLARMARHRLVYDALSDLMPQQIHALSIKAFSPDETVDPTSI
ncbi:MAG: BolA family transcriptional regulator [Burkholderiaceae bacterium]|nr:MAG: BolA family transcriptional regulator [Burkholderiaceae bacterium]